MENNISNPVELNSFKSDFLRRFQFLTKEPDVVPEEWYVDVLESKKINFTPINQNGKYGYEKDHKTIGYCQFLKAEPFYQNMNTAIVETYRGVGLLSYSEGISVRAILSNSEIKYRRSKSENIPHSFELITSDLLNSENLSVSLTDPNGESVDCYKKDEKYEFKADATSGSRTYTVIVQSDNLVQHVGKLTYYYHQESDPVVTVTENKSATNTKPSKSLIISIKRENNGRANRDKTCGVIITIENPNDVSVSTTVNVTGSSKLTPVTRKETIPAYGSKRISTTCTNIVKASTETVSVSTSTGERASEKLTFTINQKN